MEVTNLTADKIPTYLYGVRLGTRHCEGKYGKAGPVFTTMREAKAFAREHPPSVVLQHCVDPRAVPRGQYLEQED